MVDKRTTRLASILINYCLDVKRNEKILIQSHIAGMPLVTELYKKLLQKKAHPLLEFTSPDLTRIFYEYASRSQLKFIPTFEIEKAKKLDQSIEILAEDNKRVYSNIDPKKRIIRTKAKRIIREIPGVFVCFPTQAYAQDAGMSLEEYEDFFYKANNRNWKQLAQKWKTHLNNLKYIEQIQIKTKDTNLTMNVKARKFHLEDGRTNMPGGELYTSPLEASVNGHIFFDFPAIYNNVEIDKIHLQFKDGKVTKVLAEKGEDYLIQLLNSDKGAKFVGEFAFGLNYNIKRFTKETLFDEKIGGTIHLALGDSFSECRGKNKSAIHLDLIKDMRKGGEVYTDEYLFYKNGKFKI